MNKEYLLILMQGYVDDGIKQTKILNSLNPYGVTYEVIDNPQTMALEKVFNMIHPALTDYLCNLIFNDCVEIEDGIFAYTVEELYEKLFEVNERV